MPSTKERITLNVRLTDKEKAGFDLASEIAGLSLSSWVRERLRAKAIRELEDAGHKVPFIPEVPLGGERGR